MHDHGVRVQAFAAFLLLAKAHILKEIANKAQVQAQATINRQEETC